MTDGSTWATKSASTCTAAKLRMPSCARGAPIAEVFRPRKRSFVTVPSGFEARYFASATLLDDGEVLVVVGYSQGAAGLPATSRAWLYRP